MVTILLYSIAAFVAGSIVYKVYSNRKNIGFVWQVWKRFRLKMLAEVLLALVLTPVVLLALLYYLPFTRWGWFNLISESGGNVLTAPVIAGMGESSNVVVRLSVALFLVFLLLAIPFLANGEEEIFREYCLSPLNVLRSAVVFGLAHMIMGVPLAAGIALIGTGMFYSLVYLKTLASLAPRVGFSEANREAVMTSTAYHAMYNSIVVVVLLITVLASF